MQLFVVALVLGCLATAWAVPPISDRIYNGSPAARGQFPWQAYLVVSKTNGNTYVCSGAIISRLWVVTAGHCIVGAANATIAVGSNSITGSDLNRAVITAARFILHEGYDNVAPQNDIGLIQLSRSLVFNTYIRAVGISEVSDLPTNGVAVVAGWGVTRDGETRPSNDLQFAALKAISNAQCAQIYGTKIVTSDILCAVSATASLKSICAGDIGAPLVANPTSNAILVGLGNFVSSKGCQSTDPSGFTRVYTFARWIRRATGI